MKIYFIGQKGIPSRSGGVEKHVEDLSTRLVQYGHKVYVYTRFNYTPRKLKEYKGVRLVGLPSIPTKNLDAISHTFLACLHLAFQRKVDVVHFHSIGPSSLIWLVKLLKPRTPVVSTFHTQCYFHQKWSRLARFYLKIGEKVCCKWSDRVIVVSQNLKKYVKNVYNREAYYIPNGVSIPQKTEESDKIKQWGLEKGNYILSVSRLVKHKGIHYLIDAYKQLNTTKKLVIVGGSANTDDYVKELHQQADNDPDIIFTNDQSGEVLKELFSHAYLFVQPSESEGLSIALLEAMAYGLPVLTSDIPENAEVLEENDLLFRSRDSQDLKEKLEKMLSADSEELSGWGQKNKRIISEKYDWEKLVQEVERVYKE